MVKKNQSYHFSHFVNCGDHAQQKVTKIHFSYLTETLYPLTNFSSSPILKMYITYIKLWLGSLYYVQNDE